MKDRLLEQLELQSMFFHLDRAIAFLEGREEEAFTPRERRGDRFELNAARDEVSAIDLPEGELRSLQRVVEAALEGWYRKGEYLTVKPGELASAIRLLKRMLLARET
jgi:hypothetical protein